MEAVKGSQWQGVKYPGGLYVVVAELGNSIFTAGMRDRCLPPLILDSLSILLQRMIELQ